MFYFCATWELRSGWSGASVWRNFVWGEEKKWGELGNLENSKEFFDIFQLEMQKLDFEGVSVKFWKLSGYFPCDWELHRRALELRLSLIEKLLRKERIALENAHFPWNPLRFSKVSLNFSTTSHRISTRFPAKQNATSETTSDSSLNYVMIYFMQFIS
jgi:hypothetical protein